MSAENNNNLEETIIGLLKKRNPALHQQFIEAPSKREIFQNSMAVIITEMARENKEHYPEESNGPYRLKYSDMKMLEMLSFAQNKFGIDKSGVMNFFSMIASSYRGERLGKKKIAAMHTANIIKQLEESKAEVEKEIEAVLQKSGCAKKISEISCQNLEIGSSNASVESKIADSKKAVGLIFQDFFSQEEELKETFKWGEILLHVVK